MRIANQLVRALNASQMTAADLMELAGLSPGDVRRLLRRSWNPPLHVAARVAWAVEMPIGELFWLEPPAPRS